MLITEGVVFTSSLNEVELVPNFINVLFDLDHEKALEYKLAWDRLDFVYDWFTNHLSEQEQRFNPLFSTLIDEMNDFAHVVWDLIDDVTPDDMYFGVNYPNTEEFGFWYLEEVDYENANV